MKRHNFSTFLVIAMVFFVSLSSVRVANAAIGDIELVSPPAGNIYTSTDGPIYMRNSAQAVSNGCSNSQVATIYRTDTGDNTPIEAVNLVPGGCTGDTFSTANVYSGTDVRSIPGTYDVLDMQCPESFTESMCLAAQGATVQFSFTVATAAPVISPNLVNATIDTTYSRAIGVTGGLAPFTWSIASGSLPDGLSLNTSTGVISGTPTVTGTSDFTVQVIDSNAAVDTHSFSLLVNSTPVITSTSLVGGHVNTLYYQTLQKSGGTLPVTWSVISGSLPPGMQLTGGVVAGIPTQVGTSTFTVQLTDANGATATQALVLVIDYVPPVIITPTLHPGQVDIAYHSIYGSVYDTVRVSGGSLPLIWSIISGSFPDGLSLDPSNGLVSGTPTTAGTYHFTVQVTDNDVASDTQEVTLDIDPSTSGEVVLVSPPTGNLYTSTNGPIYMRNSGRAVNSDCATYGSPIALATIYRTDTGDNTPSEEVNLGCTGEVFSTANVYWGSDVRLTPGAYDVLDRQCPEFVTEQDCLFGSYAALGATVQFSFTVTSTVVSPPAITTTSLSEATIGVGYNHSLHVTDGSAPYVWTIASGSLPAGLSLNGSNGEISGVPSIAGNYDFTVQVTDTNSQTAIQDLTLVVNPAPEIITASIPDATITGNYSQTLEVAGGTTPLTWSLPAGSLPSGLTLSSSGILSGVPGETGSFNFTVQATDANSAFATQTLSLMVNQAPAVTTTSLAVGTINAAYSQALEVSDGSFPFIWSVTSGILPDGLSLNSYTGEIFGTPTTGGNQLLTVQVVDNNGVSDSKSLSIAVNPSVTITTISNPTDATINAAYSQILTATGGTVPLTWGLLSGSLPPGLTLSETGVLSGIPTATGVFNFTAHVTDANNSSANQVLSIVVNSAPIITTSFVPDATANAVYSQSLQATGGTAPLTWSLLSGSLPAGLALNSEGTIVGVPTTTGTYTFTVQVTDIYNISANQSLTIQVHPALHITTTNLPNGKVDKKYSRSVHAAGGTAPFVWSIISGTLPTGLSFDSGTGVISGIPTIAGTVNFTVKVLDSNNASSTQSLSIQVN
ncbi:putative Ig domain-containing protein [Candidatus Kaiserbacteria bacterium]|nr:putative Ig domain-containing protein [Candidatus Kaiserbacteria bacterium]